MSTNPRSTPTAPPGAIGALYRLVLRHQLTKGRAVLLAVVAGVSVLVSIVIATQASDPARSGVRFVSGFGLGLVVPIVSLVFGSAALGEWVEDETLVYVWLRPVQRWVVALAATLAALTVTVPATVLPLALSASFASRADVVTVAGTVLSVGSAALAYTALFVLVGLVVRRSLLWGLVYVFIWEFFVARSAEGAAKLSINTYAATLLSRITDVSLPLAERATWTSTVTPVAVAVVSLAATTWWLRRMSVA